MLYGDREQPVQVTLAREAQSVCFTVRSFGYPIPDRKLPFFFDPKVRYSTYAEDNKKKSVGLGLGLFIAAEIVNGHAGSIEVVSRLEGNNFSSVSASCVFPPIVQHGQVLASCWPSRRAAIGLIAAVGQRQKTTDTVGKVGSSRLPAY